MNKIVITGYSAQRIRAMYTQRKTAITKKDIGQVSEIDTRIAVLVAVELSIEEEIILDNSGAIK